MSTDQILLTVLIVTAFGLFAWGRWRYDAVAAALLVIAVAAGLVPAARAFDGFANPAVVTVALVLILSRGLMASGLVDILASRLTNVAVSPTWMILIVGSIVAVVSAFMNNVGALAFFLPITMTALRASNVSPAQVLMPISFATMLGGMTTLIGTPPNIIVSGFREKVLGEPLSMFDFAFVGGPVALVGMLFLALIGWRLLPTQRQGSPSIEEMIDVKKYVTEIEVGKGAKWIGKSLLDIERDHKQELQVVGLVRGEDRNFVPNPYSLIQEGDILIVEASPVPRLRATMSRLQRASSGLTAASSARHPKRCACGRPTTSTSWRSHAAASLTARVFRALSSRRAMSYSCRAAASSCRRRWPISVSCHCRSDRCTCCAGVRLSSLS
jgi:di/tricarboxylate transporter